MLFFRNCSLLFSCFLVLACSFASAQSRTDELAHQNITEAKLKNGLRVCLRQSKQEPGEFTYQLFAVGGYSSLEAADRPSGWMAADIAWESGLDKWSGDALDRLLDDHQLDMKVSLGLFDRKIEASGPTEELAFSLDLNRLLFTNPQFNEEGYKNALVQKRRQLQQKNIAGLKGRDVSLKINMRNWSTVSPCNILDLDKADIRKAQTIFKIFFSNPAEFMLVLVGDFDPKTILPLLEKTIGSLPGVPPRPWTQPKHPSFPEGIVKKKIFGSNLYKKCYTRLTFPLTIQTIQPATIDLFCIILKNRFQSDSGEQAKWKKEIRINCQYPLFPSLDPIWLVIKFTGSSSEIEPNCKTVVNILETLKKTGITENEIHSAYEELVRQRSQKADNVCELEELASYYQAGWDILQLFPAVNQKEQEKTMLKNVSECYPDLKQYSIISFYP